MWKPRAAALLCCLGVLPLIGCVGAPTMAWRGQPAIPAGEIGSPPPVYAVGPPAPAAILVMLPGAGAFGANPALWANEGFDVVTPPAADLFQYAADREAAFDRMLASARALANAPVWLIGAGPDVEAALATAPDFGRGQVSGVVVTSVNTGAGSCRRTVIYQDAGNGSAPKVSVRSSGNACPSGVGVQPSIAPPPPLPTIGPKPPRLIEASAGAQASPTAQQALVRRVGQLIKEAPPS